MYLVAVLFSLLLAGPALSLDNGLARTPPMGWLTWERFRCNIDCDHDPDNCIGEKLMMDMADRMAADGFLEAGYEYVIVDDCWLAKERTPEGRLQADAKRFPNGIKKLADYVHAKGLKFGIYEDFGTKTCGGYPGSEYYMQMDAQTFADWGVDYLKLDGCYSNVNQYDDAYPAMTHWLNHTGRPIVFSCSWPAYQQGSMKVNYPKIAKNCNLWRNYGDIQDDWSSLISIINYYGQDKYNFIEVAGPGNWNDPDMLLLGNFGLSYEQERVQMGMWCMMASPLIMSVDLRNLRKSSRDLLLHKGLIAINQDPLGKQGTRLEQNGNIQVWTKPLADGSTVFAFINSGHSAPSGVSIKIADLGLTNVGGYNVTEVFDNVYAGKFRTQDTFATKVNPSGIYLAKASPL